jgi:hypothetical protein
MMSFRSIRQKNPRIVTLYTEQPAPAFAHPSPLTIIAAREFAAGSD